METRNLTCISCPLGCALTVQLENGTVTKVTGNTCPRGEAYGRKECTAPTRILTSLVQVTGGALPVVSVKTAADIPKEKLSAVTECLREIRIAAPVRIGDIILKNAADTGVDIIATKNVEVKP